MVRPRLNNSLTGSPRIRVGVSSCLLGESVRYDGGHKHDHYITDILGGFFDLVAVCPENESGMPVPREAMRLVGDQANPRLVTIRSGHDLTQQLLAFCERKLTEMAMDGLSGFIFKRNSPSCGLIQVEISSDSAALPPAEGRGLFAAALTTRFPLLPVVEEVHLRDEWQRQSFLDHVHHYHRHFTHSLFAGQSG